MFCCFKASEQVHNNEQFPRHTQLPFWLSKYFQNNFFDSTARSGWHGNKNVEYNFLMAKKDSCFYKPAGTCFSLEKLACVPVSITTTCVATQSAQPPLSSNDRPEKHQQQQLKNNISFQITHPFLFQRVLDAHLHQAVTTAPQLNVTWNLRDHHTLSFILIFLQKREREGLRRVPGLLPRHDWAVLLHPFTWQLHSACYLYH